MRARDNARRKVSSNEFGTHWKWKLCTLLRPHFCMLRVPAFASPAAFLIGVNILSGDRDTSGNYSAWVLRCTNKRCLQPATCNTQHTTFYTPLHILLHSARGKVQFHWCSRTKAPSAAPLKAEKKWLRYLVKYCCDRSRHQCVAVWKVVQENAQKFKKCICGRTSESPRSVVQRI